VLRQDVRTNKPHLGLLAVLVMLAKNYGNNLNSERFCFEVGGPVMKGTIQGRWLE